MSGRLQRYRDDGPVARLVAGAWPRSPSQLAFVVPALARSAEYGIVTWLAWRDVVSPPAAFTFLLAVALHHYEVVYRARTTGDLPAPWVDIAGLGWDGRILIVAVAAAAGAASPTLLVLAGWCLGLFVGEATSYWLRRASGARPTEESD